MFPGQFVDLPQTPEELLATKGYRENISSAYVEEVPNYMKNVRFELKTEQDVGRTIAKLSDTVLDGSDTLSVVLKDSVSERKPDREVAKAFAEVYGNLFGGENEDGNMYGFVRAMHQQTKEIGDTVMESFANYRTMLKHPDRYGQEETAEITRAFNEGMEFLGFKEVSSFENFGKQSSTKGLYRNIWDNAKKNEDMLADTPLGKDEYRAVDAVAEVYPLFSRFTGSSEEISSAIEEEVRKTNPLAYANMQKTKKVMKDTTKFLGNMYFQGWVTKKENDRHDYRMLGKEFKSVAKRMLDFENGCLEQCKKEGLPLTLASLRKLPDHQKLTAEYFDIVDEVWALRDRSTNLCTNVTIGKNFVRNASPLVDGRSLEDSESLDGMLDGIDNNWEKIGKNTEMFQKVVKDTEAGYRKDVKDIVGRKYDQSKTVGDAVSDGEFYEEIPVEEAMQTASILEGEELEQLQDVLKGDMKKVKAEDLGGLRTDFVGQDNARPQENVAVSAVSVDDKASELLSNLQVKRDRKGNISFYTYELEEGNTAKAYFLGTKQRNVYENLMETSKKICAGREPKHYVWYVSPESVEKTQRDAKSAFDKVSSDRDGAVVDRNFVSAMSKELEHIQRAEEKGLSIHREMRLEQENIGKTISPLKKIRNARADAESVRGLSV